MSQVKVKSIDIQLDLNVGVLYTKPSVQRLISDALEIVNLNLQREAYVMVAQILVPATDKIRFDIEEYEYEDDDEYEDEE
jgi:hypothetical protein